MTSITANDFRGMMPVFADQQKYNDVEIVPWIDLSDILFNDNLWTSIKPYAQSLFVAHNLILSKRDEIADAAGGLPGQSGSGIVASKSVGGVSISYDTSAGLEPGAGHWNLTTYGTRLYRMFRLIGMGGTQLGGGMPLGSSFMGPAWPGVIPAPDRP